LGGRVDDDIATTAMISQDISAIPSLSLPLMKDAVFGVEQLAAAAGCRVVEERGAGAHID
jgi:hypothetical protein